MTSPSVVSALLDERGIRPKKRLGQHFLCDENVLNRIVAEVELIEDDRVLEIGAGIGTLTERLAAQAGWVIAVEIDRRLIPLLREQLSACDNVEIWNRDFLEIDLVRDLKSPVKVVGNLPYQITSPILERLLESRSITPSALLTVQKEVADRLTAPPGSRAVGSLGVLIQSFAEVTQLMGMSRNVFFPRPNVDSALIRLRFLSGPRFHADETLFTDVIRSAFQLRRKTIKRALMGSPLLKLSPDQVNRALEAAGIDPTSRGEQLTIEEFDRVATELMRMRP
ncbi:MAG: 16S rRNA (adenine(1518)-N(6)/adenine(1519)-N(6))-dimethyltransferase RsmA [Candidatus Bipolaricaulia bacterium]